MYQPFNATAISHYYAGGNEHDVPAILSSDKGEPAICVKTDHDYIYITKQQAMEFFSLIDPADYSAVKAAYINALTMPYGASPKTAADFNDN